MDGSIHLLTKMANACRNQLQLVLFPKLWKDYLGTNYSSKLKDNLYKGRREQGKFLLLQARER
jgi:hypothetical protein